ncbi:MAG TPA: 30S ribosomal protein S13 [Patescibacteria group bacterium]|nr:30S ribosomal protein S13 [Patescibacteria group bacterium]
MLRIAGINLPDNKRIEIALTALYGVGRPLSHRILVHLDIDRNTRTKDLTDAEAQQLRDEIEKRYRVEGELKHTIKMNVRRLKEIQCYRGTRHQKGLPSRGQRTRTNNRTIRGNKRVTMGSGRKTSAEKT